MRLSLVRREYKIKSLWEAYSCIRILYSLNYCCFFLFLLTEEIFTLNRVLEKKYLSLKLRKKNIFFIWYLSTYIPDAPLYLSTGTCISYLNKYYPYWHIKSLDQFPATPTSPHWTTISSCKEEKCKLLYLLRWNKVMIDKEHEVWNATLSCPLTSVAPLNVSTCNVPNYLASPASWVLTHSNT